MGKNVHVVPNGTGWQVKPEGSSTPTSTHRTQQAATDAGKPCSAGTVPGFLPESNTNAFANSQLVIETTKNLDGTWKLSIRINGTLTYEDPNFDVSTISKLSLQAHWGSGVVFNKMQVVKK